MQSQGNLGDDVPMKENYNLNELLNGYIDGELSERQRTELQRLVSHNADVAKRLDQLKKCTQLVRALPREKTPVDMLEKVKADLERRTLLKPTPSRFNEQAGARHLFFRKVLTAAAMFALVGVLGTIVYNILAPNITAGPFTKDTTGERPGPAVALDPTEKHIAQFVGTLEFTTADTIAANEVAKAVRQNGFLLSVPPNPMAKGTYKLSCSPGELRSLLHGLRSAWRQFDSANLLIETQDHQKTVAVNDVTDEQIQRLVNQTTNENRTQLARDFAVLNRIAKNIPGKHILDTIDKSTMPPFPPEPGLTTGDPPPTTKRIQQQRNIHLTIIIDMPRQNPNGILN